MESEKRKKYLSFKIFPYLSPTGSLIAPTDIAISVPVCCSDSSYGHMLFLSGAPNNSSGNIIYCERKIHLMPLPTPWICLSFLAICTIWQACTRPNDPWKRQRMTKMCCYSSIWKQPASSGKWRADSLSSKLVSHAIFCPFPLASRKFPSFGSGISHPNRDSPFQ